MRIVYVFTSLGMGGAERQGLALAARMAQRGHTVAVLVLRPRLAEEWPTDLETIHLGLRRPPLSFVTGLAHARRFLLGFRPDLLHSHSFHANIFARLLKLFLPSSRVISTVHNVYEGRWPRMIAYRLTDALASRTTAVSQAAADRFIRLKAIPKHRCVVLPNGIDTAEFAPIPERRAETRVEMEMNTDFVWLAAGRLTPAKDYPNLLRAFAQVRIAHPATQLWIAGETAGAKRTPTGGYVFGFVSERGALENVRFLGLRRDMPALLDAADAFVLSSAWEGMPLAVGEAMAIEKPVVATDVGGVRQLLGEAGIVVPPADPNALAHAMIDLMQAPAAARNELGRAARQRIREHFSMDARADQWEALYRTVLALHP